MSAYTPYIIGAMLIAVIALEAVRLVRQRRS